MRLSSCGAATDLDLIVIDYNLPNEKGNVIISRVRGAGYFTEVVFYSQPWMRWIANHHFKMVSFAALVVMPPRQLSV